MGYLLTAIYSTALVSLALVSASPIQSLETPDSNPDLIFPSNQIPSPLSTQSLDNINSTAVSAIIAPLAPLQDEPLTTCYSSPTWKTVRKPACHAIIAYALIDPDIYPNANFSWSYNHKAAIKHLPDDGRWQWEGCVIDVGNFHHQEVGYFRLMDVADRAISVLESCVVGETKWGGFARLGDEFGHFYVSVHGEGTWKEGEIASDEVKAVVGGQEGTVE